MIWNLNLFAAGFTALIAQTLLVREMVNVFSGNVFSLGFIFAGWLFWIACGSYLSGKFSRRFEQTPSMYIAGQGLVLLLLLLEIVLIRALRLLLHIPQGQLISFSPFLMSALLATAPLAFLVGWQFSLACRLLPSVSLVYRLDVLGSLAGGIALSLWLAYAQNSFYIVLTVICLNLVVLLLLWQIAAEKKNSGLFTALMISLILAFGVVFSGQVTLLEQRTQRLNWSKIILQESAISRYAHYAVAGEGDLRNFYINGLLSYSNPDITGSQMIAHLAMLETPQARRILVLGGGFNSLLKEVLKYPVTEVYYIELDEVLIRLAKDHIAAEDRQALYDFRVLLRNIDGRLFLKDKTIGKFDAIIVNTGSPLTAEANRFYTREFFQAIQQKLTRAGIVILGIESNENYLSPELRNYNGCLYWTLKSVFPSVIVVPGEIMYLAASPSDSYLTDTARVLAERLQERNITAQYFAATIPYRLTAEKIGFTLTALEDYPAQKLNYDFAPISYYHNIIHWGKQFQSSWPKILWSAMQWKWWHWLLIYFLLILTGWLIIRKTSFALLPTQVFIAGFAGMAVELVLIQSCQIMAGYVYHLLGILIACFMLGLVLGARIVNRFNSLPVQRFPVLLKVMVLFGLFIIALPVVLALLARIPWAPVLIILILALTVLDGLWVGMVFPLSCLIRNRPGLFYAMDLLGACVGTIIVNLMLIPLLGIFGACYGLGGLVLAAALIGFCYFKVA
ncbi:MAG: hypothetical protein PHD29_05695 [bacterium]|nr:hypothetical protein [bacterium]MDD5354150.1 hypothetical protein [bacterium]MDD5755833.1 hypothetical protein [bacterium]